MAALNKLPRLPLDGNLDLTYRCNNNCRHCWLWIHPEAQERRNELTYDEIRKIVDGARQMGCQAWSISGGEPMLRPDFSEIFEYITHKSITYTLNTNGTLITPEIARLLTRKGKIMVALYGATSEVNDHITRNPGSFDAALRGFNYLREAGVNFIVQIVPMRANYHQYQEMLDLARSLSPHYRVGAPWLWLSANHSKARNRQIIQQRLDPAEIVNLDKPDPAWELIEDLPGSIYEQGSATNNHVQANEQMLASCITARREFHIDPYGQLSFCYYIKDPALRYDLRKGTFQQAWDEFIPSLAGVIRGNLEYHENCGSCDLRRDCRWCPVYGYLEHGRYSAKVDYLCEVAKATRRYKENWKLDHLRYYQLAGITIQLTTDFPIKKETFDPKFDQFRVDHPGDDTISILLKSSLPQLSNFRLGQKVFHNPPWAVYKQRDSWVYVGIPPEEEDESIYSISILNNDYTQAIIYRPERVFKQNNLHALTTYPSDRLLLAQVFADRQACYLHASGIIMNNQGLLFVGHSEAGKSTMMKILQDHGEILCDESIIVRNWPEGIRIHGSWSHGELPDVSPNSAPLKAIMYLEQSNTNALVPILSKRERLGKLLSHILRPVITPEWWKKTLDLADRITTVVPAYNLKFEKSDRVIPIIKQLVE